MNTSEILAQLQAERERQDKKWGQQNHEFPHYAVILMEEVGEANRAHLEQRAALKKAAKAASTGDDGLAQQHCAEALDHQRNLRTELIQSAAVIVAMIECGDRNNWWPS